MTLISTFLLAAVVSAGAGEPADPLETQAAALASETNSDDALLHFYARLSRESGAASRLSAWCEKAPSSAHAFTARGFQRLDVAWKVRGGGPGASLKPEQTKMFHSLLRKADADFQKAYELAPGFPHAAAERMRVDTGLSRPRAKMEAHFAASQKSSSCYLRAFELRQNYLSPKWHGTGRDMADSARGAAAACGDPRALLLLPAVYAELAAMSGNPSAYWESDAWKESENAYRRYLTARPNDAAVMNKIAKLAISTRRREVAAEFFGRIGERWSPDVWDDRASFDRAKEMALGAVPMPAMNSERACQALISVAHHKGGDQTVVQAMDIALNSPAFKERAAAASSVMLAYGIEENVDGLAKSRALTSATHPWCRYWGYQFISYLDLVQIRDSASKRDLLAGLKDPEASVRKSAVQALGAFEDEDLIPHLFQIFLSDPELQVRERAACSLSHTGIYTKKQRASMRSFFISAVENKKLDQQTRNWAVQALNQITGAGIGLDAEKWKAWVASHP